MGCLSIARLTCISSGFPDHSLVESDPGRVTCFAPKQNTLTGPGLDHKTTGPGVQRSELRAKSRTRDSSALTITKPCLPQREIGAALESFESITSMIYISQKSSNSLTLASQRNTYLWKTDCSAASSSPPCREIHFPCYSSRWSSLIGHPVD